jgi:Tat protein translocase TatB subunit
VLNVGTPEMLVILVVALLVLGPNKLPEVARQVGKAVGEIRRLGAGFQAEMRDAMQEPVEMPPAEPEVGSPEPEAPAATEGVAPGWSPEGTVEADTEVLPPVDDEPPDGVAPV